MGEARHPPQRTPRPAHRFHLYLWRRLSKPGQGRSPHPAVLQHRGDEPAPRGNSQDRHARGPRRSIGRSGWLAPVDTPRRATKHHHYRFAAKIPRTQSGREHLAIYARQLAVKPHLQVLRRSCRSLLLRLEQARRSALENHVHRIAPVGPRVLINETWYKRELTDGIATVAQWQIQHALQHGFRYLVGKIASDRSPTDDAMGCRNLQQQVFHSWAKQFQD